MRTYSGRISVTMLLTIFFSNISAQENLIYHDIRSDNAGNIIPWYADDPAKSYDHVLHLIWNFWDTMRVDINGIPYYMNHQVWRGDFNDPRGLGGDQLQMALSSWQLYYRYSGNERVKENMKFICDYYLSHGLSSPMAQWANIPFPYNTLVYSGIYDGDMVIGKDYTQPDKAGSFGRELIVMYKMMTSERYPNGTGQRYLDAAVEIANTLARQMKKGDYDNSPLPFKVNVNTGELGQLRNDSGTNVGFSSYTTNWSGTMELFLELISLKQGNIAAYEEAFSTLLAWMKAYPMKNSRWGPFFEDIPGWSDTQINAMTWARFMMNHQSYFPIWKTEVQHIIDWVYKTLGNDTWKKYGVTVINEQTVYQTPGNSHTSRQAADELLFASLTGDTKRVDHAVRLLNWATYMVDFDGKNRYPRDENWLTDGYGDYVRHYLRAMEAWPSLATSDHLVSSTSVIQHAGYHGAINKYLTPVVRNMEMDIVRVYYRAFDPYGTETIRLSKKPSAVLLDDKALEEIKGESRQGFSWQPLEPGGILTVRRLSGHKIIIASE